jgi:hypothetical protein
MQIKRTIFFSLPLGDDNPVAKSLFPPVILAAAHRFLSFPSEKTMFSLRENNVFPQRKDCFLPAKQT